MMKSNYHEEQNRKNITKLRELLVSLPPWCHSFFRGIEEYTSSRTRIAYAYDVRVFFEYIQATVPNYKGMEIRKFPLRVLEDITREDILVYLDYLSLYEKDGKDIVNGERGKARKLATLRSFFHHYFQNEKITKNTAALVPLPKMHDKVIVRLDVDEVSDLLDLVDMGEGLSKNELRYYHKTRLRDLAILTLLLGTGMRVSECVGINLQDIDSKNNSIKIRRKGGYETYLYYGEEVEMALFEYVTRRLHTITTVGHEDALFLSLQNRRITVRAVENLVKKYASRITMNKKITPHKLRSTYGTTLYQETGDIYLVADVLGHKDVNTTKKHYAAIDEDRKKGAANAVRLRGKNLDDY